MRIRTTAPRDPNSSGRGIRLAAPGVPPHSCHRHRSRLSVCLDSQTGGFVRILNPKRQKPSLRFSALGPARTRTVRTKPDESSSHGKAFSFVGCHSDPISDVRHSAVSGSMARVAALALLAGWNKESTSAVPCRPWPKSVTVRNSARFGLADLRRSAPAAACRYEGKFFFVWRNERFAKIPLRFGSRNCVINYRKHKCFLPPSHRLPPPGRRRRLTRAVKLARFFCPVRGGSRLEEK